MKRQAAFVSAGKMLKGALHCHTTRSDGKGEVSEVIRLHKENGYDFMAVTDHRFYNYDNFGVEGITILPGMEMDGNFPRVSRAVHCHHIVCVGPQKEDGNGYDQDQRFDSWKLEKPEDTQAYLDEIHQNGNLTIYAHPQWSGTPAREFEMLEGVFDTPHMFYTAPVFTEDGYVCGTVFACSATATQDELLGVMIKTIIISSLWIMLAALIAVYIITERVIGPLKDMSRMAKEFAKGNFEARVPVRGRDEVASLAVAFNDMADSISRLEVMRNTFVANVSHDLRTPMTTISGFIDNILSGAIPPEKHQYYLELIRTEVGRLARLVSSLLDISRIQAGERKFEMRPFDVCEMARRILISFEAKIEGKHLDVEFDCDRDRMPVLADHDAIYQILYNICDNAVKF